MDTLRQVLGIIGWIIMAAGIITPIITSALKMSFGTIVFPFLMVISGCLMGYGGTTDGFNGEGEPEFIDSIEYTFVGAFLTVFLGVLTIRAFIRWYKVDKPFEEAEKLRKLQAAAHEAEQARKKEQEQQRIRNEQLEIERRKPSIQLYKMCCERNITSIDTAEDKKALCIIAYNKGINDPNKALSMFNTGKIYAAEEDRKHFFELRKKEKQARADILQQTKLIGKDKYLKKARAENDAYTALSAVYGLMSDSYADNSYGVKANTHDWAALGGLADGIAGPAAGIATALQVQAENEKAVQKANQIMHDSAAKSHEYSQMGFDAQSKAGTANYKISKIEDKLVDVGNTSEKFNLLTFTNFAFKIKPTKNIEVSADYKVNTPVTLIGKPAILDGSLMLSIKDTSGNTIAKGYYCAPGFDDTELSFAGFKGGTVSTTCIVDDFEHLNSNEKFSCQIEPINLWTIEK